MKYRLIKEPSCDSESCQCKAEQKLYTCGNSTTSWELSELTKEQIKLLKVDHETLERVIEAFLEKSKKIDNELTYVTHRIKTQERIAYIYFKRDLKKE